MSYKQEINFVRELLVKKGFRIPQRFLNIGCGNSGEEYIVLGEVFREGENNRGGFISEYKERDIPKY